MTAYLSRLMENAQLDRLDRLNDEPSTICGRCGGKGTVRRNERRPHYHIVVEPCPECAV